MTREVAAGTLFVATLAARAHLWLILPILDVVTMEQWRAIGVLSVVTLTAAWARWLPAPWLVGLTSAATTAVAFTWTEATVPTDVSLPFWQAIPPALGAWGQDAVIAGAAAALAAAVVDGTRLRQDSIRTPRADPLSARTCP